MMFSVIYHLIAIVATIPLLSTGADATLRIQGIAKRDISNAGTPAGGGKRRAANDEGSDEFLKAFLESDECSGYMESLNRAAETIMNFDDDTIIQYFCNDIQRIETLRDEETIQQLPVEYDDENLTCELAFELLNFKNNEFGSDATASPVLVESMSSFDACKEETSKELEIIHEARRALNVHDGERKLFFWFFVTVVVRVVVKVVVKGVVKYVKQEVKREVRNRASSSHSTSGRRVKPVHCKTARGRGKFNCRHWK